MSVSQLPQQMQEDDEEPYADIHSLTPGGFRRRLWIGEPIVCGRSCIQNAVSPAEALFVSRSQTRLDLIIRPANGSAGVARNEPGSRSGYSSEVADVAEVRLTANQTSNNPTMVLRRQGSETRFALQNGGAIMLGHGDMFWLLYSRPDTAMVILLNGQPAPTDLPAVLSLGPCVSLPPPAPAESGLQLTSPIALGRSSIIQQQPIVGMDPLALAHQQGRFVVDHMERPGRYGMLDASLVSPASSGHQGSASSNALVSGSATGQLHLLDVESLSLPHNVSGRRIDTLSMPMHAQDVDGVLTLGGIGAPSGGASAFSLSGFGDNALGCTTYEGGMGATNLSGQHSHQPLLQPRRYADLQERLQPSAQPAWQQLHSMDNLPTHDGNQHLYQHLMLRPDPLHMQQQQMHDHQPKQEPQDLHSLSAPSIQHFRHGHQMLEDLQQHLDDGTYSVEQRLMTASARGQGEVHRNLLDLQVQGSELHHTGAWTTQLQLLSSAPNYIDQQTLLGGFASSHPSQDFRGLWQQRSFTDDE